MHGKRAGYLFGSFTNLAVEGFMGWRLGLVMYSIFLLAFHSVPEAIASQVVATIAVGGFGFFVAQFRTITLEARINEVKKAGLEDKEERKQIKAVKRTMNIMVFCIITIDVLGAVYIGVTASQADGLVGHAIAGSLLLGVLAVIPFCAGGFIQAVAKLIPQEKRQTLMEHVFYQNLDTMDQAVARYGRKARKLPPEQVLAEGWAGLAAAAEALDTQEGNLGLFADSVAQMRALQAPIQQRQQAQQGQEQIETGDEEEDEEPVALPSPRKKDWITAEVKAVQVPNVQPQLAPPQMDETLLRNNNIDPEKFRAALESGELRAALFPFASGMSQPAGSIPNNGSRPSPEALLGGTITATHNGHVTEEAEQIE